MKNFWINNLFLTICVSLGLVSPLIPFAKAQQEKKSPADLQDEITKLKDSLKGDFQAVAKDFQELKNTIKSLEDSIKENKTTLELKLNKALERIDALEKAMAKLQGSPHVANRPPANGNENKDPLPRPDAPPDQIGVQSLTDRLAKLEAQVAQLESDIKDMRKRTSFYTPDELGLDEMKSRMGRLEKEIASIKSDFGPRVSRSAPLTGQIILTNTSPEMMLFRLNQTTYRVNPYSYMVLNNQPAGTYTYEVISSTGGGSSGQTVTTLNPGEVLRLTAAR